MKIVLSCFYIFLLINQIFPQSGWLKQESGTTENLISVRFITKNRGMVISDKNSILRTTNGGKNWEMLPAILEKISNLSFRDTNTVFVITTSGKILRSDDFGLSWVEHSTGRNTNFKMITFLNDLLALSFPFVDAIFIYPKYSKLDSVEIHRYSYDNKFLFTSRNSYASITIIDTLSFFEQQGLVYFRRDYNLI